MQEQQRQSHFVVAANLAGLNGWSSNRPNQLDFCCVAVGAINRQRHVQRLIPPRGHDEMMRRMGLPDYCRQITGERMSGYASLNLDYPFRGRWQVRNSPANRVPSHGTALFGLSYAIDFVPVDAVGRSAPFSVRSLFRTEPPEAFVGFGQPILSPVDGLVVGIHDAEMDHASYRGFPSVGYAMTQRRRVTTGAHAVLGNHVLIETTHTRGIAVVVLCHLQRHSIEVTTGQHVVTGQPVGRCGNSGNSTEPHLHLHAVNGRDITRADAVPIQFNGSIPRNGTVVEVG